MTFFTPFPAPAPCVALSESPKLRAKQGHAKPTTPSTFNAKLLLHILTFSPLHNSKSKIQNPSVAPLTPSSLNPLPPFPPLRPLREQSAFTLVELLAVIGIMGLLAVVAVPALKGLTGSGGRKQALNQVIGALEIARNTAISTGTNAAVIFPDSSFASGEAYKYRSMAIVTYSNSTIATNTSSNVSFEKLVSSWIVLPQGISFLPAYLRTNTTTNMISVTASIQIPPKTNSTSITCPGVVFQSDGGLLDGGTNSIAGVGFFEGTVDASGKTNPTSKMTNFETVRLTRYTGRTIPTLDRDPAP